MSEVHLLELKINAESHAPHSFAVGFLFWIKERSEFYGRGGACRSSYGLITSTPMTTAWALAELK